MSAWLKALEDLPRSTPEEWQGENSLYFIIDRVLQPQALEKLYQAEGSIETRLLFQNSDYAALLDSSPVWVSVQGSSAAGQTAAQLCHERLAGIAIHSSLSAEDAFLHAQSLLTVSSSTHGESLCRYYDPRLWAALALSLDDKALANLFGPWARVLTPAHHQLGAENTWLAWEHRQHVQHAATQQLSLGVAELELHQEVRWLYWVSERSAAFASPLHPTTMRTVIDNLQLLSDHGIDEARHLLRLLPGLDKQPLRSHDEIMSTLRSDLPLIQKLEKLEG
jgi:hypothetical protein